MLYCRWHPAMTRARKHREPWAEAIAHLRRVDPYCAAVIDQVGPCRLEPMADRFGTLVRAIISQQISSKAAAAIEGRLRAIGGEPHVPAVLLSLGEEALRGVGLSGVKARYVLNLAEAVAAGQAPLDALDDWDDDAIIAKDFPDSSMSNPNTTRSAGSLLPASSRTSGIAGTRLTRPLWSRRKNSTSELAHLSGVPYPR